MKTGRERQKEGREGRRIKKRRGYMIRFSFTPRHLLSRQKTQSNSFFSSQKSGSILEFSFTTSVPSLNQNKYNLTSKICYDSNSSLSLVLP